MIQSNLIKSEKDKLLIFIIAFILFSFHSNTLLAQEQLTPVHALPDSTRQDSTVNSPASFAIDAEVKYKASDSIYTDMLTKKTYLYGNAEVSYQDVLLKAHTIVLDMDSSTALAYGTVDSLDQEIGLPVFTDPSGEYSMRRMKYNFKSEKAIIEHIVTEQGEGFVVGSRAKKIEDDAYCMKHAKYTTCDNHDHPHFYLNLTKAKVIPGKKTVTGPAYLVVEDVKLPIAIPFAIIPSTSSYSSGFIFPSYRDEQVRGFGLTDGGYYWAANDYFDLMVQADIFTNGSWATRFASNYKKRYKFGGRFNFQYINNIFSEKDLPDYRKTKDMSIAWTHRQDAKANPYQTFSASVNFSTSSFDQNNVNNLVNPNANDISRNTKRSSISYSKRWAGRPFNFSANLLHSQNSRDTTIDLTIPDLTFTVNRIYPFKRKNKVGTDENLLEKISLSYTGNLKNYVHTKESDLSFSGNSLTDQWKNGVKHSVPIAMSLKFLKHFTVNPSFNYTERWYFKQIKQGYDEVNQQVVNTDTTAGFNRVYDYSLSAGTSTKIYTFFKPWEKLFGDKVDNIRHVATPSVSFSYRPDFGQSKYGYYDYFEYYDESRDEIVRHDYSNYEGSLYGTPGKGRSGSMGLSLGNTLEMKLKSDKDTTGFKKVKIIESLNFNTSYNFLADSLKWQPISMSGRTKVLGTNINFGARFDPYALDTTSTGQPIRVDKSVWSTQRKIARLESANLSFGFNFGSDTFKKKDDDNNGEEEGQEEDENIPPPMDPNNLNSQLPSFDKDRNTNLFMGDDGYAEFSMPWTISVNYSLRLSRDGFNKEKMDYDMKVTSDVNLNGNVSLTPKWKVNFSTGYSFDMKTLAHTNLGVSRDLHCWSMNFNIVPVGRYKSYFFTIRVNSSMLQDLKYEKRNSPRDNPGFYQ
ncbi:putative LPS assembly protein LptD [Carboxylicivirga sp. N1Y90]|uniref:putative LPS assembly protein LptD n=1 Tax=Carboxylicivirga fragile TaxID=3417571 RepID=UPI003D33BFCA|nr:LPS-assembly protein LptD [Marinilabiliaceae bacterium N1Y90]